MEKLRNLYDNLRGISSKAWKSTKRAGLPALLVGAATLGLARRVDGSTIPVNDIADVVEKASEHGGESRTYSCSNITYNNLIPDKNILVFAYRDNTPQRLIGGLENFYPMMPGSGTGFINKDDATFWGLDIGQVLADVNGGFFACVDLNNDGDVGIYNLSTGLLSFDVDEYFAPDKVQFTGFGAFPASGSETIASINVIPEPATLALIGLGAAGLAFKFEKKKRKAS